MKTYFTQIRYETNKEKFIFFLSWGYINFFVASQTFLFLSAYFLYNFFY